MDIKQINLALQGGGAHGAFTWGVLDRLLDEPWLEIAAVTGTSAGALNGAALKAGLASGKAKAGREAARRNLDYIWTEVAQVSDNRMVRWMNSMMPVPRGMQRWAELVSPIAWMEAVTRVFSPYDYGPFYTNPLHQILCGMPHPRLDAEEGPRLFVTATNVRTGRVRVFSGAEVSAAAVMASACLPTLYRAVEIDDPLTKRTEAYWDGGYAGNPALFPLYDQSLPRDVVIVNINPMLRDEVPRTPVAIQDRINEISFNASLMNELRSINFVKKLKEEGRLEKRQMKIPLVHMILDDKLMTDLGARTKLIPKPGMLDEMKAAGQTAADEFLSQQADALGRRDTVDLTRLFANTIDT
ncbi:MAG: patatin-like phospholipase family protein [Paracoccus sp. (in: a-proteobacteria)]|nr:patatin-like phospholipase family protein [Paracoccus sp. (in: a-proteobacteria)]